MNTTAVTLRLYQTHAIARVDEIHATSRAALIVLATGMGKTVIAAAIMAREVSRGGRCLFLAHREELIRQTAETVQAMTGAAVGIEMAESRALSVETPLFPSPPIVVGTVQSVSRRLHRCAGVPVDLIVIDEAHHSEAASYQAILEHWPQARVVGVTATPLRGSRPLAGYDAVAIRMSICDAIDEGWLVPVRHEEYPLRAFSLDGVDVDRKTGDYQTGSLASAILRDAVIGEASQVLAHACRGRRALIFVPSVAVAHGLAHALRAFDVDAHSASGDTHGDKRRDLVARFRSGEIGALVNCALWTEGFDAPRCDLIGMLRPTRSIGLYLQMIGRGTRPLPGVVDGPDTAALRRAAIAASAKQDCVVLDLVASSHHKALRAVDLYDALAGRELADEEREEIRLADPQHGEAPERWIDSDETELDRAAERAASSDPLGRLRRAIEAARAKAGRRAARLRDAEQRRADRAEREREVDRVEAWTPARLRHRAAVVADVRAVLGVQLPAQPDGPPVAAPTEAQVRDAGKIGGSKWLTSRDLALLHQASRDRWQRGCTSHSIARWLHRCGVPEPWAVPSDAGRAAIECLRVGRWRVADLAPQVRRICGGPPRPASLTPTLDDPVS